MPREPFGLSLNSRQQVDTKTSTEGEWTAKSLSGVYPRFNNLNTLVEDEINGKIYDYGGIAPSDKGDNPNSDFHVCDTKTMTFRNLTKSLRFWDSTSLFPQAENEMQYRRLPALGEAGAAFLHLENRNLMFLFGGYDGDEDQPSSKLIAIDLDSLIWWVVDVRGKVEGGHITARINPAMTAIDNKIYIFAGITQYAEDPEHLRSYSIAAYHPDSRTWRWEVSDMPYPDTVPPDRIFQVSVPVHKGKMILLTPGRRKADDCFRFKEDNMFYFHTTHKRFQTAYASGSLPGDVFWYYVHKFDNFEHIATPDGQLQKRSSRSPRPSGSHHPYRSSNNSATAFRSTGSQFTAPSVLICTWVRRLNTEYLIPELWRFFLSPDEHITCLNIGEKVWDLDLDLRRFVVVGKRMIFFGFGPSGDSVSGTDVDSIMGSGDDDRSDPEEERVCNVYVDVPVRQFLLNS